MTWLKGKRAAVVWRLWGMEAGGGCLAIAGHGGGRRLPGGCGAWWRAAVAWVRVKRVGCLAMGFKHEFATTAWLQKGGLNGEWQ
ncbi:MAG: hypothetical protein PHO37_05320 [Kiritimatiellae bacterium]|nr:hypothetical protein [Kiritimatiellia bacterium]